MVSNIFWPANQVPIDRYPYGQRCPVHVKRDASWSKYEESKQKKRK